MKLQVPGLLRRNPNFRRYFIGRSASLIDDQVSGIALPLRTVLALHDRLAAAAVDQLDAVAVRILDEADQ